MECIFCGKRLIISKKFIETNDTVECSNCKNTFKFIPENIKETEIDAPDKKISALFLLYRIFIAAIVCSLYFYFSAAANEKLAVYYLINSAPIIICIILSYIYFKNIPNYPFLFNDKYLNTFGFWLCAGELILAALLNLTFFVIY